MSELITDLGRLIGDPLSQPSIGDEEVQVVDDGLSDDSAVSGPGEVKRARSSFTRPKKFRHDWMRFDIFKDWLRPHPNPELANCVVCNRVIKAGKSELEKHATGKRHLKMLKDQQLGMVLVNPTDTSTQVDTFLDVSDSRAAVGNEAKQFVLYRDLDHNNSADDAISAAVEATYAPISYNPQPVPEKSGSSSSPTAQSKLFVTKPAPHWRATAIVNGHVTKLDVNDYKGRYVVLFFYAHNFSKVDASEINRLSDRISEFRNVNTEIVACSTDSHLSHLTWVKMARGDGGVAGAKIPLIADPTHSICTDYGVYIPDKGHCLRRPDTDEVLFLTNDSKGALLEVINQKTDLRISAHFIIDRRGILRHMAINDPLIGRGTDELLRIAKALQFSDQAEDQSALVVRLGSKDSAIRL